ncbi:diguanylate cyclase [bacterium]|nr:diguanylate cyclase [bacterium]
MSHKHKKTQTKQEPNSESDYRPRILVVEDDPSVRNMIIDFLGKRNFEIYEGKTGEQGLELATTEKPDVILTDLIMPGLDGLEMIRQLRQQPGTMLIPIIVLTAINSLDTKINVFRAGGDGLLIKPFDLQEMQVRIERAIQISRNFMKLTYIDALTAVYNRRLFDERLPIEINRTKRYTQPLSLVMIDIDFFKSFNDTYGHRAGDFVLSAIGQHLRKSLRTQDFVCRYGGEEFAIIMPMTKGSDAAMVMSRIRADLQERYFYSPYDDMDFNVHISVGVAQYPDDAADYDSLVRAADDALYEAKNTGRNKVVIYSHELHSMKNKLDTSHL